MAWQSPAGPLSGIIVVDMTRILAGPWATHVLADLGATVLKVEPPGGDATRGFRPSIANPAAKTVASSYFVQPNNGKQSIELDLKVARPPPPPSCAPLVKE